MRKRFLSLTIALVLCTAMLTLNLSAPILGAGAVSGESSHTQEEIVYDGQNTGVLHTNIKLPASSEYGLNVIDVIEFDLSNRNLTVEAINSGTYLNSQKTVTSAVGDFNDAQIGRASCRERV